MPATKPRCRDLLNIYPANGGRAGSRRASGSDHDRTPTLPRGSDRVGERALSYYACGAIA
jgi:hypothetical protein